MVLNHGFDFSKKKKKSKRKLSLFFCLRKKKKKKHLLPLSLLSTTPLLFSCKKDINLRDEKSYITKGSTLVAPTLAIKFIDTFASHNVSVIRISYSHQQSSNISDNSSEYMHGTKLPGSTGWVTSREASKWVPLMLDPTKSKVPCPN